MGQAEVDIGTATRHCGFVFTAQPAEAAQLAERAFHDSAVRQNDESGQVIAAFNDL